MAKFETLTIWQESILLAEKVYKMTLLFPTYYQHSIGDQLRRSSLSISSNIAEGSGSDSIKDEIRYISIALKSSYECLSQLILCDKLQISTTLELRKHLIGITKQTKSYMNYLKRKL